MALFMHRKVLIKLALIILYIFYYSNVVFAWDDKTTHRDLSEKAFVYSILNQGYLKGIGIDETIEYLKWVKEQIKDGAKEEDSGNIFTSSFYNHYHNPRLTWDKAGLNTIYPFINGKSSLLWAQDDSNEWSWQKAREYYYLALTSSTDTVRSENFAKTFKGVGHIKTEIEMMG